MPTLEQLLDALEKLNERRPGCQDCIHIRLYSDGSGRIAEHSDHRRGETWVFLDLNNALKLLNEIPAKLIPRDFVHRDSSVTSRDD